MSSEHWENRLKTKSQMNEFIAAKLIQKKKCARPSKFDANHKLNLCFIWKVMGIVCSPCVLHYLYVCVIIIELKRINMSAADDVSTCTFQLAHGVWHIVDGVLLVSIVCAQCQPTHDSVLCAAQKLSACQRLHANRTRAIQMHSNCTQHMHAARIKNKTICLGFIVAGFGESLLRAAASVMKKCVFMCVR